MSQSPSGPKRLIVLPLKNAALVHDVQLVVPDLAAGQHAFNGCAVHYQGWNFAALRVNDDATRTQHLAVISYDIERASTSGVFWLKQGPQADVACSDEDPRLIVVEDRLYIVYNSVDGVSRHMRVARLVVDPSDLENVTFSLQNDKELRFTRQTGGAIWEKNWSPFSYGNTLHLIYRANPPLILRVTQAQLDSPDSVVMPELAFESSRRIAWGFGDIRGGTPAIYDTEMQRYVTFFHSAVAAAGRQNLAMYYVAGMYTFMPDPPFEMERITGGPLVGPSFYDAVTYANGLKKSVIFPQGLMDGGDVWRMMYGKNDATLHVATWDKAALLKQTVLCEEISP